MFWCTCRFLKYILIVVFSFCFWIRRFPVDHITRRRNIQYLKTEQTADHTPNKYAKISFDIRMIQCHMHSAWIVKVNLYKGGLKV